VDFLKKTIKSGDVLCRYQGTGIGSLEVWATGGMCSHMGIFMWGLGADADKLFFLQSDQKGIRICSIEEMWEQNDGTASVILPLAPEMRAKFDTKKAFEWFKTVEGNPYGYANFLFTAFDTPEDNFPQITDANAWNTLMSIVYSIKPKGPEIVNRVWTRAMSKRLGFLDENLTWP
jgi:hypothetical protein